MEIKKIHWIGIAVGLVIMGLSLFFMNTKAFFFLMGVGILIGVSPFWNLLEIWWRV